MGHVMADRRFLLGARAELHIADARSDVGKVASLVCRTRHSVMVRMIGR